MISGRHNVRNTKAYFVNINGVRLYFSYDTLIGVSGKDGTRRRMNGWGPTTGRHMREFDIEYTPVMEEQELEQYAMDSIYEAMLRDMKVFENA